MIAKPLAFLRRDLGIAVTYRLRFVHSLAMLLFSVMSLDFLSSLMNQGSPPALSEYGSDYFAFALVGLGIVMFAQAIAGQFPATVRSAQVSGTLEVITASRTSLPVFLGCSALYGMIEALFRLALMLGVGALMLGAVFRLDDVVLVAVVLTLTAMTFAGLGILGAAFTARFNQSEPFTGAYISASLLLSGVFYPTSVLPGWLEIWAPLLPLTHAVEALRGALLDSAPSVGMAQDVAILAGFALILPVSLVLFDLAIRQARMDGTLAHY